MEQQIIDVIDKGITKSSHFYNLTPFKTYKLTMRSSPIDRRLDDIRKDMDLFEAEEAKVIAKFETEGRTLLSTKSRAEFEAISSYYDSYEYFISHRLDFTLTKEELELFNITNNNIEQAEKLKRLQKFRELKKEFEGE